MALVYIGLGVIGISSAALVAQVIPTICKWYKQKSNVHRTGRKVRTTIVRKEK